MAAQSEDLFVDLVMGYRKAKIVFTAHELGLFRALENRPATAEALAKEIGTNARATRVLLGALVTLDLVTVNDGVFSNTPLASERLIPGAPGYVGHNLTYQELLWPAWSELQSVIKTGEPLAPLTELLGSRPGFVPEYLKSVEHVSTAAAAALARFLPAEAERIVDIGGGLGTYARAFARRSPGTHVTVLDLPATVDVAEQHLGACPEREQIHYRRADYLKEDFGRDFDFALLSHVTHDESFESNQQILRKAFAALKPGGMLGIHDWTVSDDGSGSSFATLFSVNLLVYTYGQVYSLLDYTRLLTLCGFVDVSARPVLLGETRYPSTFITAVKPSSRGGTK